MTPSTNGDRTRPVLVVGGAGFVGATFVARLLARGERVVVFDNFSVGHKDVLEQLKRNHEPLLTLEDGDLRDEATVTAMVQRHQPRAVAHLAAIHFIPYCNAHPAEALHVNVVGSQVLLEALGATPVERLVFISSAAVYAPQARAHRETDEVRPDDIYGLTKLFGEHLVRLFVEQTSIPSTVVRLFNVYGPGETNPHVIPEIMDQLGRGDVLELGTTSSFRDMVHVRDVAAALEALVYADPPLSDVVNVGSGEERSIDDLVATLADATGRPLRIEHATHRMRKSDRPHLRADIGRITSLVSWRPREDFAAALLELVQETEQASPATKGART